MVLIKPNERKVLNWITEVNENVPSVFQFELYEYQNVYYNIYTNNYLFYHERVGTYTPNVHLQYEWVV